jgi:hypothetical protein
MCWSRAERIPDNGNARLAALLQLFLKETKTNSKVDIY